MAFPVIMPKFEMSQESAVLIEWKAAEGDPIRQGDPLLEVETDKVTMEVEAPASGILAAVSAQAGDIVPVTEVIAQIVTPEEWANWPGDDITEAQAKTAQPLSRSTPVATPLAQRLAADLDVNLSNLRGSGPGGKITKADVEAAASVAPAPSPRLLRATPAARRVARETGLDLAAIPGSGPRGRIQQADVEQAAAAIQPPAVPEAQPGNLIPLTGMRAAIARRMTESYRTAPHIHLTLTVDVSAAQATRQRWTELSGQKISLTILLVKACAWALRRHPALNATIDEAGVRQWDEVNVGVAVALPGRSRLRDCVPGGLIVPVLPQADRRPASELARTLADLAERARRGALQPHEVSNGSFTLTNLGMFGIESFDPIINPPQVAILGVGAVIDTVVPRDSQIVVRPLMQLTLAADHRALDGAIAAHFLQDLRRAIEDPSLMLL